ncbi:MAG: hypothetical protein LBT09_06755 [Planctomycetaceae bacterium]|jgi:hypothetical protein|nr:hypothetical protein [Planctomycetaceae bacterium]
MLKKIIKWIDSFDDKINPIVVREMRKVTRNGLIENIVLLYFGLAVLAAIVVAMNFLHQNVHFTTGLFTILALVFPYCIMIIAAGGSAGMACIDSTTLTDEIFATVSLSPRQQLNSYWSMTTLGALFMFSLLLPLSVTFTVVVRNYFILLIPVIGLLFSQALCLEMISIGAQFRTAGNARPTFWENFFFSSIVLIYLGLLAVTWVAGVAFTWAFIFAGSSPDEFAKDFGLISLYILLPIVLLANGIIAYKQCKTGFNSGFKTNWYTMIRYTINYIVLNIICAIIYIGTALIYAYVT